MLHVSQVPSLCDFSRCVLSLLSLVKRCEQFGFRPTGSTTCALVHFIHHATLMIENNSYVRCLLIDFSKAFDVVKHAKAVKA